MIRASTFALCAGLLATPAMAQGLPCAPREVVTTQLAERYGEHQASIGTANHFLIEFWRNDETGTWTVLRTDARGTSCALASCHNWTDIDPPVEGDDS